MPVDYSGQDLRGRDFSGQDLTGANLTNADPIDAILRPGISRADMDGVKGVDTVKGLLD